MTLLVISAVVLLAMTFGQQLLLAQEHKLKIGFSLEAMNGERWQVDRDAFADRARELGAEVISTDAGGDDDLQLTQVKGMIQAGIQALVLLPHDTAKATRIVDAAKAAHVKVISYDRMVQNSDVDLYVSFDRVEIGRMQAEALVQLAPKGNYVLIGGSPNDEGAKILHDEQMKVLRPYIDRGDIKVVADDYCKEWLPSEAYVHMLSAIDSSQGTIAAVVASNDGTAGGAIQALSDDHLAGKVLVSGQDADLAAVIRIAAGTQTMTVYKPIRLQAASAAEAAVQLVKGETVAATSTVGNGKRNVPAILLRPVLVTKDSVKSTVVKDGLLTLKQINLGLPADRQIN